MKIGLFTSGYQRNPLEHAFIDAKRFGYDYIELWGGRPHAFAPDLKNGDIEIVKKLIDQYEIQVRVYTPEHNAYPYNFMIGTEQMRKDAIDYLKLSMEMGKEMGAEYTLMSPAHAGYLTSEAEIWQRLIQSMKELTDYAEKIDHKIILEALTPMESNVCTTANDLARVFGQIESTHLVGMCDIVPPFVQHESMMAYFDKLQDKMQHLHIIDSDGTSDTHMVPGEGVLPMKELLMELKQIGYVGTATIELVTAYMNEPRLFARRAINNLKALMD
ncbi:fructoselysine 3-epimerase [Paenibacillus sp. A14]|uniref:fructoselysine 3-epimerase n=1 Tax=Paenibacillus sp. A14 TaxID=3119820 RepID=UPI002FE1D7C9